MELRKDYILNRWVLIATERSKRPKQFQKEIIHNDVDYFAPGNEHTTPPEIGRIAEGNSWKMRWFNNKFPLVQAEGNCSIETHNKYFTFSDAVGHHEVIVETPDDRQMWDLDEDELVTLLNIYRERIITLQEREHIKYVSVFKNHGAEAGTSLIHSHSQIVAQAFLPPDIMEKVQANQNCCHYCSIINIEKSSDRRCFENDSFVAFTPYASRFSLELWIFSKEHLKGLHECSDTHLHDLAKILRKVLFKLKGLNAPFNMFLQYAPKDKDLHFHIEFTPRLAKWAGFEFATGTMVNSMSPETAAQFYRD